MQYTDDPSKEAPQRTPYFKIGSTRNLERRLRSLSTGQPFQPKLWRAVEVPNCLVAERRLLDAFPPHSSLDGGEEWRWLSADEEEHAERLLDSFAAEWQGLTTEEFVPLSTISRFIGERHRPSSAEAQQDRYLRWAVRTERLERVERQARGEEVELLREQPEAPQRVIPDVAPQSVDHAAAKAAVQQEAVEAVLDYFTVRNGTRASVVLPGGAGKTVFGLRVAEALRDRGGLRSVLVLLPTLDLVSQTVREWRNFAAWGEGDWASLAVCSKVAAPNLDHTTDAKCIAEFLRTAGPDAPLRAIFCTYHSNHRLSEALEQGGIDPFDLCICDEAHETAGFGGKKFARPLYDRYVPASRRLFMTATPRCFSRVPDKEGMSVIASMQDVDLYGPVVYRLSYREAVQRGLVAPLRLVVVNATEAYERLVGSLPSLGVAVSRGGTENPGVARRDLAELALGILDCIRRREVSSVFSFHPSNAEAKEFQQVADQIFTEEQGEINVERVSGQMPPARRREVLHLMGKGQPVLVTNARVLTTGVSVPEVDMVVLAGRPRSQIPALQAMARAARVAPGKTCGYVMVPLAPTQEPAAAAAFDAAVDAMALFVQRDEQLLQTLQCFSAAQAELGRPLQRHEWPLELQELVEADTNLPLQVVERVISTVVRELVPTWDRNLALLRAFFDREGHASVPLKYCEDGVRLGLWLSSQRAAGRQGRLLPEQRLQLEELGVDFSKPLTFEDWLQRLKSFGEREGHVNVPSSHQESGKALGAWLDRMRSKERKGTLKKEERGALQELGVDLRMLEEQWPDYFNSVAAWASRFDHADLPASFVADGRDVGRWLERQRYRARNRGLTGERRQQLEAAGVELDVLEAKWMRWFRLLEGFREREGHFNVPSGHKEDGKGLGIWLGRQRALAKDGRLSPRRHERLEAFGLDLPPLPRPAAKPAPAAAAAAARAMAASR